MANKTAKKAYLGGNVPVKLLDLNGDETQFAEVVSASGSITAAGRTAVIAANFTRPANVDAYAAKDVVSNSTSATTLMTIAAAGRVNAGSGYITKVRLVTNQKANTAQFRVYFYHTTPTGGDVVAVDNSPYLLLWNNRDKRVGYIDMPAMSTEDSTNSTSASALWAGTPLAFACATADSNLYAVLVTQSAFNPASEQQFYLEVAVEQN